MRLAPCVNGSSTSPARTSPGTAGTNQRGPPPPLPPDDPLPLPLPLLPPLPLPLLPASFPTRPRELDPGEDMYEEEEEEEEEAAKEEEAAADLPPFDPAWPRWN